MAFYGTDDQEPTSGFFEFNKKMKEIGMGYGNWLEDSEFGIQKPASKEKPKICTYLQNGNPCAVVDCKCKAFYLGQKHPAPTVGQNVGGKSSDSISSASLAEDKVACPYYIQYGEGHMCMCHETKLYVACNKSIH